MELPIHIKNHATHDSNAAGLEARRRVTAVAEFVKTAACLPMTTDGEHAPLTHAHLLKVFFAATTFIHCWEKANILGLASQNGSYIPDVMVALEDVRQAITIKTRTDAKPVEYKSDFQKASESAS